MDRKIAVLLDYRPERYFTIAYPPLAILAGYALARLLRWEQTRGDGDADAAVDVEGRRWATAALVTVGGLYVGYTGLALAGYGLLGVLESLTDYIQDFVRNLFGQYPGRWQRNIARILSHKETELDFCLFVSPSVQAQD